MTTTHNQAVHKMLERSSRFLPNDNEARQPQPPQIRSSLADDQYDQVTLGLNFGIKELQSFCDRHFLTTCSIFQTAWAIVLACYAGTEDVSFIYGTNQEQRSDSHLGRLYLRRTQINPKSTLLDTVLSAEEFVGHVSNQSDCSRAEYPDKVFDKTSSTFNSGLFVNHRSRPPIDQKGWGEIRSSCHVAVQLTIENDSALSMSILIHASESFPLEANNVAHTLYKTLQEIVRVHSQTLVEELDICSPKDLKQILEWNQSPPHCVESCFHWIFDTVVRKTPHAMAICSWDRNLTYQELDTISTKLANSLRCLGVIPETFVGICFDKTAMAYVCMLGILKAGGAFVAIDPSYPATRIQTIVEATKASVFMAEPAYCHLFDKVVKHTMAIDSKIIDELPPRPNFLGPHSGPSNIAYAAFTSGSTGVPKGIMIEHRSLCSVALALASPMRIDASSRVLQFSAYTFDVSYGDTFVTWAQGGCVCVPSEHERVNDISGAMMRMNVNNACLIPSVARMLQPENVPCLKVLNLGGEALVRNNLDTWADKVTLTAVYGPSEGTVWCTSQTGLQVDSPFNTIGRGTGTLLWITSVTNHERLCPVGCIGELLIEGPGLARGYFDAAQTSNAFVENPSWAKIKPGQRRRFYKTGDLVRYRSDGTLSFIGRIDTQIKLHGRRVELGEIEYHLSSNDLLRQSMVLFPSAGTYRQKLVAMVVLKTSTTSSSNVKELKQPTGRSMRRSISALEDVKKFLSSRLPLYMLPQEWIVVEDIPLLVSGKMNRVLSMRFVEKATGPVHEDLSNTSPQDHKVDDLLSDRLRQIWSEALEIEIEEIGMDSEFVSLGGDSLSAIDLVSRCKSEGWTLAVSDVLNGKTIRRMAIEGKDASLKVTVPLHEDVRLTRGQYKLATPRPLVLRPVWWETDPSSVAVRSF